MTKTHVCRHLGRNYVWCRAWNGGVMDLGRSVSTRAMRQTIWQVRDAVSSVDVVKVLVHDHVRDQAKR